MFRKRPRVAERLLALELGGAAVSGSVNCLGKHDKDKETYTIFRELGRIEPGPALLENKHLRFYKPPVIP